MKASSEENEPVGADIEVMSAQAYSVLRGLWISLLANSFIALTTTAILYSTKPDRLVFYWLGAILTINSLRLALIPYFARNKLADRAPAKLLALLTFSAFVSGIAWTSVPVLFSQSITMSVGAYVVFIIGGISAGALIQSTACARISIAFMAPQLLAVCLTLFSANQMVTNLVALNVTLLSVMLLRSAIHSEKHFVESVKSALRAGRLATSLKSANEAISDTNRQLELLANHDALTKLASRSKFNAALADLLDYQASAGGSVSLLIFDLDKFKSINDTYGHPAGDQVLVEFSRRILSRIQPGELAARLGGDEFAIIISGKQTASRASELARDILSNLETPIKIAGSPLKAGSSIGIATFPTDASDSEELFQCADAALYRAKELGSHRVQTFDPSLLNRMVRQKTIESSLEPSIRFGKLHAEFQPQVRLNDGSVAGFEALVRWDHPVLGSVAPEEIAQAARNTQNTMQLVSLVTNAACRFLLQLERDGWQDLTVAVNISPTDLSSEKTADELRKLVEEHGIAPNRIEFEITEDSLLDAKAAKSGLRALEDAGFLLAVDDFGMGYSSLSYLIDNHIDRLKIDRKFVQNVASSPKNQALVAALISVSNALSMDVLAEGVENERDAEALRMLGCRTAQGFLYGHSMRSENALAWLNGRTKLSRPALSSST